MPRIKIYLIVSLTLSVLLFQNCSSDGFSVNEFSSIEDINANSSENINENNSDLIMNIAASTTNSSSDITIAGDKIELNWESIWPVLSFKHNIASRINPFARNISYSRLHFSLDIVSKSGKFYGPCIPSYKLRVPSYSKPTRSQSKFTYTGTCSDGQKIPVALISQIKLVSSIDGKFYDRSETRTTAIFDSKALTSGYTKFIAKFDININISKYYEENHPKQRFVIYLKDFFGNTVKGCFPFRLGEKSITYKGYCRDGIRKYDLSLMKGMYLYRTLNGEWNDTVRVPLLQAPILLRWTKLSQGHTYSIDFILKDSNKRVSHCLNASEVKDATRIYFKGTCTNGRIVDVDRISKVIVCSTKDNNWGVNSKCSAPTEVSSYNMYIRAIAPE